MEINLETLCVACVAIVNGAEAQVALEAAQRVMTLRGNKPMIALIRKQLQIILAARSVVSSLTEEHKEFVLRVIGVQIGQNEAPEK